MHRKPSSKKLSLQKAVKKTELAFWKALHARFIAAWTIVFGLLASLAYGSVYLAKESPRHLAPLPQPHPSASSREHGYHGRHSGSEASDWVPAKSTGVPTVGAQVNPGPTLAHHRRDYIVVRPGMSLWSIAKEYLGDPNKWAHLWEKNRAHIPNPSILQVGERVYL